MNNSKNHETIDLPDSLLSLTQSKNLLETPRAAVHPYPITRTAVAQLIIATHTVKVHE